MPDITNLTLFLAAAVLLAVTPGPDTLYVVARSIGQGRMAGMISVLGICIGILVHIFAAAIGLSALLMTSVLAYHLIKYAGAAYLIYLGMRTLMSTQSQPPLRTLQRVGLAKTFFQGILSSALNPKLALFFLAFLPQFVTPSKGRVALQIIWLGVMFIVINASWLMFVALLASYAGVWLRSRSSWARFQRWFTGSILIGLGIRLAVPENR